MALDQYHHGVRVSEVSDGPRNISTGFIGIVPPRRTSGPDRQRDEPARRATDIAKRGPLTSVCIALDASSLPAPAMPAIDIGDPISFDTRPRINSPTTSAGHQDNSMNHYTILISAPSESDEHAIASAVSLELDRRERERAARDRSSM
ncbi:hypothetical protein [Salinicola halophyticus]|uniref:hypothetical protein n=1 Tax=Salinicola halophyticus TaxID=1808881 RepID=UPI003F46F115